MFLSLSRAGGLGVDWEEEAPEFLLMWSYAGCCAAAAYTGFYTWDGARSDLQDAKQDADKFDIDFQQQLRILKQTSDFVLKHFDLKESAVEILFRDKYFDIELRDENILLIP